MYMYVYIYIYIYMVSPPVDQWPVGAVGRVVGRVETPREVLGRRDHVLRRGERTFSIKHSFILYNIYTYIYIHIYIYTYICTYTYI